MNRSWPDLCFKKREDSELQPKADDGIALLSAIVFGFLFLAWLLAFISLNASLGVVRTTKDLRFNPYQRGGSILIARAFATLLGGDPSNWNSCSISGMTYSCIINGSSQGSMASQFPDLAHWSCSQGGLSLQASAGSSCLKALTLRLDTEPAQMLAHTATGRPGRYLHQQATLQFRIGAYPASSPATMTRLPSLAVLPLGSPCPTGQATIQGRPSTRVDGALQLYCGPPSFTCANLRCAQNLYVDDKIQLLSGRRLENQDPPPTWFWPTLGSITSLTIPNGTNGNPVLGDTAFNDLKNQILVQQCGNTLPTAADCQTVSTATFPESLQALYIPGTNDTITVSTKQELTISSGLALLVSCRSLNFSQKVRLGTNSGNHLQGALVIIAAHINEHDTKLQDCPTPPTYTFGNLDGAISVIAPGASLTLSQGQSQSLYGTLLARQLILNSSDFHSDALVIGTASDTINALNALFGTLLVRWNRPLSLSEWSITP